MVKWKQVLLVAGLCSVMIALSGCATETPPEEVRYSVEYNKRLAITAGEDGHEQQEEILRDGRITAEEYSTAFESLKACIEEKGYTVSDPMVSPLDGLRFEFNYNSNGLDQDQAFLDYEDCEATYWLPTAPAYSHSNPQRIDEPLKEGVILCLENKGITVDKKATAFQDLVGDSNEDREAASDCAGSLAFSLYPDLPAFSVDY